MSNAARVWLTLCGVLTAAPALAQPANQAARPNPLRDLSAAVETLSRDVSPSVVQVLVTGYGPVEERDRSQAGLVIGRQRAIGSGAIIDADGYIITNAHVVSGAQRVQVVLHDPESESTAARALAAGMGRTVDARIVGAAPDLDLALLKIDATGLRALALADYDLVHQGELVFAFGSPEGLRNSVTMGVVSAVARQPDPDRPNVYIQTDAPINPGNSGGPLVDVDGRLVGIDTFILTESGGSQGLGFAIPSAIVAAAYPQLRKFGHLHRGLVGINVQAITPAMAQALSLARSAGVVVSDVAPGSPADMAGVQVQDVVSTINGRAIDSVPMLSLELDRRSAGDTIKLGLLRGTGSVTLDVTVAERPHAKELTDLADPTKNAVHALGIIGVDITAEIADTMPGLRIPSGVLVVAREQDPRRVEVALMAGDVIHALNRYAVRSLDGLRVLLEGRQPDSPVVLQIERDGQLMFITAEFY
ncbi:MAG: trypsin-like peptidase domain-containing protein [Acidobacteriia bacterium]|nr:trypsin-like peptidase domain-containing protein [Terriglobia bacterium]